MQFHSSYKCAETSELNVFHGHTCIQHSMFLGKRVIQTNPSKFDERLFSFEEKGEPKRGMEPTSAHKPSTLPLRTRPKRLTEAK